MGDIGEAARCISDSQRIFAFVGAGLSKESGLATFRGPDGVMNKRLKHLLSVPSMYKCRDEALEYYEELYQEIQEAEPNRGHEALAELAENRDLVVATQNIDRLFEAVSPEDATIHYLHGRMDRVKCHECRDYMRRRQHPYPEEPPCEWCEQDLMRPDIVLYGEPPCDSIDTAERDAKMADVCLFIGTSGEVVPANDIPKQAAKAGATYSYR